MSRFTLLRFFLVLWIFVLFSGFASAASPYIGQATINEIYRSGSERFIEVKLLNTNVSKAQYDTWQLKACRGTSVCTNWLTLDEADPSGYPWFIFSGAQIPGDGNNNIVNLSGGMALHLRDASGETIDYVSVAGYSNNSALEYNSDSVPAFDWQIPGSNTHLVARIPDGTGDWGNSGPGKSFKDFEPSDGYSNDEDPNNPDLILTNIYVTPGQDAVFTLNLSSGGNPYVAVSRVAIIYKTYDGYGTDAATAPEDYVFKEGIAYIEVGQSSTAISVTTEPEAVVNSYFYLSVENASQANGDGVKLVNHFATATFIEPEVVLHHIEIEHSGTGLTCASVEITIKACANEECDEFYTGGVNLNLTVAGQDSSSREANISVDESIRRFDLTHFTAEEITLGASNIFPVTDGDPLYKCYIGSSLSDCKIVFHKSGLIVDIPLDAPAYDNSVSGTIRAVKQDLINPESCAVYDGFLGMRTIDFGFEYENPTEGSKNPQLREKPEDDRIDLPKHEGSVGIKLDFGSNASADFNLYYEDAGKIRLHASFTGEELDSEGNVLGLFVLEAFGNREIVFYPTHFRVTAGEGKSEDGSLVNPLVYGGETDSQPTWVAGQPFFMLIEAGVRDGDDLHLTRNFQTTDLELKTSWAGPELPVDADWTWVEKDELGLDKFAMTSGSHWLGEDDPGQRVDEVGAFHVTIIGPETYLGISDFLENKVVTTSTEDWGDTSAGIGRFTPDHFVLTRGTLTNRAESVCPTLPPPNFTYLGENLEFTYTLTVKNKNNQITNNYIGPFHKFSGDKDDDPIGGEKYFVYAIDDPNGAPFPLSDLEIIALERSSDWGNGEATFTVRLNVERDTELDGPFDDVRFGVYVQDGDGVEIYSPDLVIDGNDATQAAPTTKLRYGRMVLDNAYGPETMPLRIPVRTEYYNGSSFVLNEEDSCTPFSLGNFKDIEPVGGNSFTIIGSGTIKNGEGRADKDFTLSSNNNYIGDVYLEYDLDDADFEWLKFDWSGDGTQTNPTAKATFGIFKGNPRLIYMRESVW